MTPVPFTLEIPEADIEDLKTRLTRTRLPDQAPDAPWAYGTDLAYMRDLIPWWRDQFDWRLQEAKLNAFAQFKVPLHGINLHFIRAEGKGPDPMPLLLMHGWPGSVFEFMEIIPRLTDPGRFGGDPRDAFTVIAPSLPGFGLSFRPGQPRFSIEQIADCLYDLMRNVLGYERFGAQGGDYGAFTATRLGVAHPGPLVGIHLNFLVGAARSAGANSAIAGGAGLLRRSGEMDENGNRLPAYPGHETADARLWVDGFSGGIGRVAGGKIPYMVRLRRRR